MNNRKRGPRLFPILLVFLLIIIAINFISGSMNKPEQLTLEQLITKIDKKQVANVSITPNQGVYVINGQSVTTQQGQELATMANEKFTNSQVQLNAQNELSILQTASLAGKTSQEQQTYIKDLEMKIAATPAQGGLFSRQLATLQGNTMSVGKPFQAVVVSQQYQIEQITKALDENEINYNVYPYKPPFDWLGLILQLGTFGILGFFIFNMMRGKAPGADNKDFTPKVPKTRFSDVIGYEEEKQELMELVDFLKHPQKYHEMGAKLPSGVLLEGPPGTGKTLMAKAVAGESNVPFFAVSGSDFEEMYVGLGASRIRKLFKEARKNSPAIIFIDEIDAIGKRDVSKNSNPAQNQTINSLLVEMDGFESEESTIIVMAATNRKDNLDGALLRPGRFDRQILVDLPPVKTREAILKYHLSNKHVKANVDYSSLARSTTGMSGAQLSAVANEGALLAVRERKNEINQEMLQEAIDRVLMGPAKITNKYSRHDKQVVSYHESGHCIVGLELEGAMEVQKITIIPRRDAGGYVSYIPSEEEERFTTKQQLLDRLTSLVAGRCSEEIFIGDVTVGAYNDFEQATKIARNMVTRFGFTNLGVCQFEGDAVDNIYATRQYSEKTAEKIDNAVDEILNNAIIRCKEILERRADDIHLLAKTIREREVLDKEQIDFLMKNRYLPEDVDSVYDSVGDQTVNDLTQNDESKPQPQVRVEPSQSPSTPTDQQPTKPSHTWPRNNGNSDANNFM